MAQVWGAYIAKIREHRRAERGERSQEKIESLKVRLYG
jgi:hypothetical protein